MINKRLSLLAFCCVFLSGCIRSPFKSSSKKNNKNHKKSEFVKEGGTYVFSDDADEFHLEEDASDVFSANKKGYAGDSDDFQWDNIVYDGDSGEVIQFDFDNTNIKPTENKKVKHNAEIAKQELKSKPNTKVCVKGHSCKIAKSDLYNRAIAQERAEHVAQAYAKQGVPRDKMSAVGYGATELLTDEDGRDAQAKNRRVETDFIAE